MNSTLVCDTCLASVGLVEAEVKLGNATAAVLATLAMKICAVVGGKIARGECDFISKNIEKIISMVTQGMNKTKICQDLKFC